MTTPNPGPSADDAHAAVYELLGAHALGHLDGAEREAVTIHVRGCGTCRRELADLRPLAAPLDTLVPVDLDRPEAPPPREPSPGGFDAIRARIRAEAAGAAESGAATAPSATDPPTVHMTPASDPPTVHVRAPADPPTVRVSAPTDLPDGVRPDPRFGRRRTSPPTRFRLTAAAAVLAVLAGGLGFLLGADRGTGPAGDRVSVQALVPGVDASAGVVPHTWGVEVKLAATGFEPGRVYRASVLDRAGNLVPAGEFVGTGQEEMRCNLNSSVLRDQAAGFLVTDVTGRPILRSGLT